MALNKLKLEQDIRQLKDANVNDFVINFSEILANYYKETVAADASPSLSPDSLVPLMIPSALSGKLIETLGAVISSWSLTWSWVGGKWKASPGTTNLEAVELNKKILPFVAESLSGPAQVDNLAKLVDLIHEWSLTMKVTLTGEDGSTSVFSVI
jgi:hypothetical protein